MDQVHPKRQNGTVEIKTTGPDSEQLTEEQWQAIINNDSDYNNQFFYAVKSTGIFCKPSCKSRVPRKENVLIFFTAQHAISAHFRPCKRCRPTGQRLPDQEWVSAITEYIDKHYDKKLTLSILAEACHGSPYHLHRTFKKITGITPVAYIQQTRMDRARLYLANARDPVTDIALFVGIPNISYFITLFKKETGLTPTEYRQLERSKTTRRCLFDGSRE
ncbi:AraC family transcriptional regulator [Peribacillus saganii]|uniref:AraC family transcriptional regulator n=1 Tax=Peribacillus saganii TaxID=2303992 RepID=A0A372LS72_9BACI|nr:bifunctional transcriptional activator/DNA repair enzyme AdaA [Peribacillus saganii]RFU71051.1 AraC family transcriptional regulator [Peribacillus saganii]